MTSPPYKRLLQPRALLGFQRQRLLRLPEHQQTMRSENGRQHHDQCVLTISWDCDGESLLDGIRITNPHSAAIRKSCCCCEWQPRSLRQVRFGQVRLRRQPSIAFLTRADLTRHEPPPLVAHDYPWRVCRANFTTERGSQGSWTAKRRAAGAALTAGSAVVTR